ncbi:MAG: potassium-transporting ATPase subunit KdpC [Micrococcales bacterium]|nr:potassium-transporting ATPase subunit KdpC [Micrococcales bacterium]
MPFIRQSLAGLRLLIGLMVVLGLVYPLAVTGISQLTMRWQADGSLLTADGGRTDSAAASAGSALIGQDFTGAQWFHSRPSAGGWNTLASGGSNLGPTNPSLAGTVAQRRAAIAAEEGVSPADVPADAVTASASGLDPDISPDYARLQVARVARENGLPAAQVSALVAGAITGRDLGFLGEPRVNVLQLNLALRNLEKMGQ